MVTLYDAAHLYNHANPGFGVAEGVPDAQAQQAAVAKILHYAHQSGFPLAYQAGGGYLHLVLAQLARPTIAPEAARLMRRELLDKPEARDIVKSLEFVLAALAERSPETLQHLVHHAALIMMEFERVHGSIAEHPSHALQALVGALGHDVGKLALDPQLLHKHTRLNERRFDYTLANFEAKVPDYPEKAHDIAFLKQAQQGMMVFCGKPLDAHPPAVHETIALGQIGDSEGHTTTPEQRSLHTRILARIDAKAREHIPGAAQGEWLKMAEMMQLASPERGTLTAHQKAVLNSHDPMGAQFFSQQSLPESLKPLPELVDMDAFRDKQGEQASDIAKLIHLTDIFEALTADRSYRRAYDVGQALHVMQKMAQAGELDAPMLEGFIQGGAWKRYAEAYGLPLGEAGARAAKPSFADREQQRRQRHETAPAEAAVR